MKAKATNFVFGAALVIIALVTAPTCGSCKHRQATSAQVSNT